MAGLAAAAQVAKAQQPTPLNQDSASDPTLLDRIVSQMEDAQQRNRDNFRAYTMTREYKLYGAQEDIPKTQVIADVNFVPPDRKTFKIEKTEGNDRGITIVRHLLEHEAQADAAQTSSAAIDRHNYDFKLLGEEVVDGQPCWTLQLIPKREDKTLLHGTASIDKQTYLIHYVQGALAKSPSWWLKKVETSIRFGNAAGMWLPTQTRAEAEVRMFGLHIFTAQVIKLQTDDQVAPSFSSRSPNFVGDVAMASAPGPKTTSVAQRRNAHRVPPLMGAALTP